MTKLLLGSALVSGIVTASGALAYRGLAVARDGMKVQYVDYTVAGTDLAMMANQLARFRSNIVLAASAKDRETAERLLEQQRAIREKVTAGLNAYAATTLRVSRGGRAEKKDLGILQAEVARYFEAAAATTRAVQDFWDAAPDDRDEKRRRVADTMAKAGQSFEAVSAAADELIRTVTEVAKDVNEDADAAARSAQWTLAGGTILAIVVSLGIGLLVARLVTRPLNRTVTLLEAVANGDLTQQVEADTSDEVGRLSAALAATIQGMRTGLDQDKVDWQEIGRQRAVNADYSEQIRAVGRTQAVIEFKPDGTVVSANDNFLAVMGYSAAEVVGRHHSTFVDPAEASGSAYRDFWAKLARGEHQAGEFRRVGKNGKDLWLRGGYYPIPDATGKVQKVVEFASDITAEKAAQIESARTKSMLDSAPINVMFADREFKIRYANAATTQTLKTLEKHLPIRPEDLLGQSIDVFHKRPEHQRRLVGDPKNLPHRAQIGVGPETLELNISPVFDHNRQFLGSMVSWAVITERLRLEQQVKDTSEQERARAEELRRKVDSILATVNAIAQGDFTATVPDLGEDVVGQMGAALNQAIASVRAALDGVREVSEQLADASGQLAAASEEISTGAQEQASSLEETASTLEEITATVKQNSDSAQQARQLASNSKDVAEKGGQVVGTAVEAMDAINQSSKKIADIITAIDEIAFQTNLLALNAAVEAARAGEQGRGFAVVASEVRNLAQRSATAAKEIKALIQDSVKKVDTGTELVNRSGSTLNEIVTSVKRVTDIVTEIAAASREQSTGIDQVNKAVSQMDTVTQRNASQTEEMSATSQTLTEQANQLRELVGRFKLSETATRGAGPAPAPAARGRAAAATAPKPKLKSRIASVAARSGKNGHQPHDLDLMGDGASADGFTDF
ncbi:chemotaxis protein : Methyl-accepting chemotaxis protein OS=Pseudoalteromonas sp. BSi20429 GN=mcp PE=4 SV=1: 4HB_MCP_1: HAMP: PAS_9: PAS_8: MCPsignal [Gemmataceae bacterium]|nr:chemotaxis protein : Methyl-accepting chemotaxis protein OS=Pseudoalteromonas sp. BSi20429 GN=mcp PE=4 SV=1: 4HB_MCP_1: HAMP: PAS_9: PAS_8: MCPsignal [Gemmataceae bacterium]VTT97880.1 chemotaxis protein : Methyl-accepting chemotaxis protein OS=Pseudoalteromonas sp. BSi20429 GN=mcp PE=4 SV=1: 4HB_MCP_1: HAMP: PAS_9: PAS_8: MCPsignal [Gemmataceae bacterium]